MTLQNYFRITKNDVKELKTFSTTKGASVMDKEPTIEQRLSMLEIQNQKLLEIIQKMDRRIKNLEGQHV